MLGSCWLPAHYGTNFSKVMGRSDHQGATLSTWLIVNNRGDLGQPVHKHNDLHRREGLPSQLNSESPQEKSPENKKGVGGTCVLVLRGVQGFIEANS